MSRKRLSDRVPSSSFQTIAKLLGHNLQFHKISKKDGSGKCDINETNDPKDSVIGVVYEIEDSEKPDLDKKEGLNYGYNEKTVNLTTSSGESIQASTYYATSIDPSLKPYHWYKEHVLRGAKENKPPKDYIKFLESIESIPDPDPQRHEKEMGIYC